MSIDLSGLPGSDLGERYAAPKSAGAGRVSMVSIGPGDGALAARQQAWNREMERSQMSQWFQPFIATEPSTQAPADTTLGPASVDTLFAASVLRTEALRAFDRKPYGDAAAGYERLNAVADLPPHSTATVSQARVHEVEYQQSASASASSPRRLPAQTTLQQATCAASGGSVYGLADATCSPPSAGSRQASAGNAQSTATGLVSVPSAIGNDAGRSQVASRQDTLASVPATPASLVLPAYAAQAPHVLQQLPAVEAWPAQQIAEQILGTSKTAVEPSRLGVFGAKRLAGLAVRTHAQWTPDGLHLWLGMDGSAQQVATQVTLLLSTLQGALQTKGQRLSRVVCNGEIVWDSAGGLRPSSRFPFATLLGTDNALALPVAFQSQP